MRFSINSPDSLGKSPTSPGLDELDELEAFSPSKGNVSLDSSIEFICTALKTVGIDLSAKTRMDARVCDALYTLLQLHEEKRQYALKLQNEVEQSRQVINLERKQTQMTRNEMQAKDKQLKALENRTTLSDETVKHQLDKSKKLADDLTKRLKAAHKKIEIKEHQMKQKEVEYEKLQVVLRRHMEDKQSRHRQADQLIKGKVSGSFAAAGNPTAASTLNSAPTTSTVMSSMPSPRQIRQDDSIHGIVAVYESKHAELDRENKQLKLQLVAFEKKYVDAINKLEGREKTASMSAMAATGNATSIVDADFIESIPTMSAGQLCAEIASRLKILRSRISNLEWHAHRFDAADGPVSIREKQLAEDLEAARSVLHDQGFMLTNVLKAVKESIINEQRLFEAKIDEANKRFKEEVEQTRRKFAQDKKMLDEENQAQVFCLKQEFEREVAYHKEQVAKLEDEVASMQDKIEHMKSSHHVKLEEGIAKARKEFDDKADDIRAGADATIESMAAESSRIQLDYKKMHGALREEAEALREELAAAHRAGKELQAKIETELRASLEAEIEAKIDNELSAKFKTELEAELQMKERHHTEKLQQLEASYSAKIDMLLKEKQEGDSRLESMDAQLEIVKEQLADARHDLRRAEQKLCEHHDQEERHEQHRRSASLEVAKALQNAECQYQREKKSLLEMVDGLEDNLRSAKRDISERDEAIRQSRLKEHEANLAISKYGEMTEKYADLLKTYAPGLGAGSFLERGISRKAQVIA